VFGLIGLLMVFSGRPQPVCFFNLVFGLIDLYQAIASYLNLPPKQFFLWTRVDDILHIILGVALVLIGLYGILNQKEAVR
jgi:hypothetical protein